MLSGTYKSLDGKEIDLDDYSGKVVLVVNTASLCGFSEQLPVLEELYNTYKDKDFIVLGFPSGAFADQELETSEEISDFCQTNYNITFPLFEKTDVLEENKLFLDLAKASKAPNWNYTKYLIGKDGELASRFPAKYDHDELVQAIEKELA